ncbi:MAG: hypothetical protein SNG38_08930 [Rikenellaceae bacterium]
MRKLFFILGVTLIAMTSCVKDDQVTSSTSTVAAQLKIEINETSATRADDLVSRYVIEAYSDAAFTEAAAVFAGGTASSTTTTSGVIDFAFDAAEEYHFLLWADNGTSYDASDLSNVSLVDGEEISQAWQGTLDIVGASSTTFEVTLNRAVSKVNLIETNGFYSPEISVAYDRYTAFNVAGGDVAGDASAYSITYTYEKALQGALNDEPLYLLAPVETATVMDMSFSDLTDSFSVTNIPVQANYITNINGHFSCLFASSITVEKSEDAWTDENPAIVGLVQFKDEVFEEYMLAQFGKILGESLTEEEALTLTTLSMSKKGVTDMTGINSFTNLTEIDCTYNDLTSLDISKLNKLTSLKIAYNYNLVDVIDPEDPSKMTLYYCHYVPRTVFDLSKFTGLKTLYAYGITTITTIDFRNSPSLSAVHLNNDTALETIYLNSGQTNSGTWSFINLVDVSVIFVDDDGHEEVYGYGEVPTIIWSK